MVLDQIHRLHVKEIAVARACGVLHANERHWLRALQRQCSHGQIRPLPYWRVKYVDHAPLERQVRGMARDGLDVDSQTLWDYVYAVARLLRPAHEQLRDYLLTKPVIGADETWWRLMTGKSKKRGGDTKRWHVWAACTDDAVYFTLEDTRGLEAARKILETYEGVVMCDGYGVYRALQNRGAPYQLAHCWSHYLEPTVIWSGADYHATASPN